MTRTVREPQFTKALARPRACKIRILVAQKRLGSKSAGWLRFGSIAVPCSFGRAGIVRTKREGDGGTPAGWFSIMMRRFRCDRGPRLQCMVPSRPITVRSGWCDDVASPVYNRAIDLPSRFRHERLWRDDPLYNQLFVLGYNFRSRKKGVGSAIFFHIACDDLRPTEGCVAIRYADMRRLVPRLSRRTTLVIS